MDAWYDNLDGKWRELPVKKQYKHLLYCLLGCLIITTAVILECLV